MNFFLTTRSLLFFIITFFYSCNNSPDDMKKFFTFTDTSESPRVFSAVPTMGDKNLPRNQSISVIFSKAMNINTCVQSFSISPPNQGFYELAENTLKFTPSALFAYGSYTYTITKNCEDKEGRDLKDVWTASFTVGEATIAGTFPEVKSATVATGTTNACNSASGIQTNFLANSVTNACMGNSTVNKVTVQFSRPMDRSLTQSSVALSQVTNVSYLWESDTVLTLVPDFPFAYNQRVTLNIATTAADQFGIKLQTPVTASFLIGTPNLVPTVTNITVPADTLANCSIGGVVPTSILSGNVTNGCLGNPTRSDIVFTFSTSMEPAITQNGIVFSPSLQGTYVWSNNNTTLTFTPDSLLSYGTRYTASLGSSVQSTLRVPLLAPFSASFIAGGTTPFNPIASHTTFTGTVVNCNGGLGIATDFSVVNVTDGCLGNPTLNPIVITFLVAMDKIPTQNAVIISGGVTGTYAWSVGDTVLTFTPDNYLTYGTRYTVTLGVGAKTATGIATTTSTSASFIAGGTTPFNPLLSMNTNFGTLAACNAGTGVLNDFLANPTLTNGCL
ncbi:MAG: Ig-like domain-containing protein, partial [Leptospiraceae bacterium]|nr:Ig-like domain-containing protein [Leptospiraceae bacterium]